MEQEPKYQLTTTTAGQAYKWGCDSRGDLIEQTSLAKVQLKNNNLFINNGLVQKIPQLKQACNSAVIPRLVAPNAQDIISATKTGGRTFLLEDKVTIDLSLFGWGEEGETQEFGIEIKGAGADKGIGLPWYDTLLRNLKINKSNKYKAYAKLYKELKSSQLSLKPIQLQYVLSIMTEEFGDGRPSGGQNLNFAIGALEDSIRYAKAKNGIKIAPVFEIVPLPKEVAHNIRLISGNHSYIGNIAQEKRLMPSTIRGIYFGDIKNNVLIKRLCGALGKNPIQRENVYKKMVEDSAQFLEIIPKHAKRTKKGYSWHRVGDIKNAYNRSNVFWDDPVAFYLAKDVVIAPSGIYFVDLESFEPNEKCSEENFQLRQEMYITNIFKDFTKILGAFKKGMSLCNTSNDNSPNTTNQELELKTLRELYLKPKKTPKKDCEERDMQQQALSDIIKECNKSENTTVWKTGNELKVKISYPNFKDEQTFTIPLERLHLEGNL
ncbi:hypothetical protein HY643_03880 [Candidatus Woesearchaeota archaeon]|nr:hypothetical protein [Candidatus Woesearchaeota archaeon]